MKPEWKPNYLESLAVISTGKRNAAANSVCGQVRNYFYVIEMHLMTNVVFLTHIYKSERACIRAPIIN